MIAYFSMEVALEVGMPTYSGGLGVLAGDTVRSAADLRVPLVAVTLLHRKGYFYQRLDSDGRQREEPVEWVVGDFLTELPERVAVTIEGRPIQLRVWRYEVTGIGRFKVPVYFLDADLPENSAWDRSLTDTLYGGDPRYRLGQEIILGIGGVRMLRALGHRSIERFHMNEGHSSLLVLELLDEQAREAGRGAFNEEDMRAVRGMCVFTTHTPVAAGHDQFPLDLVDRVVGRPEILHNREIFCCEGVLNMTYLALNLSHYVNGVAKKHGDLTRQMFAGYAIDAITNGVHSATWAAPPFQELFDVYVPGWREDNASLRYALGIPPGDVWNAHTEAKRRLIQYVNRETNTGLDVDVLTLGFARRATAYKRGDLLVSDAERLKAVASRAGLLQIVFGGKAHPQDTPGQDLIQRIFRAHRTLLPEVKTAYLENYDLELAQLLVAGVDVWVNTPQPNQEASGTSGMKAALNGVPSLSVLDGWWIEGHIEGVTGWSIGERFRPVAEGDSRAADAISLYAKLEQTILPIFYHQREKFIQVMLHAIALNGSFFNTQRMMQQYVLKAYFG
jgi:starch phosphorylase